MKKTICILSVAFLAIGCGSDEQPPTEETTQAAQEETADNEREIVRRSERQEEPESPSRREEDPEKRIPRVQGETEEEGYGLTMVVDGSTPEAFQESLELIAMDTSKDQYRRLDSALRFLGTYDTAAWKGLPNLYQTLDGMTGEEIIERAQKKREERSGN
ncbi:hypothetical protein [Wenzhouxiangella sp. EGI_FJ10305]|uniref:hypothetical protein n=1 Tax=Wenzhouxiangella sp. EGI_FJ10305 TaxID=3243768 RepID=UPI0035E0F713